MIKVYEEGYDCRHGMATAIPVLINDLLLRAVFMIKQHFYDKISWKSKQKRLKEGQS